MPAGSCIFWSTVKDHFAVIALKMLKALICGSAKVLVMRIRSADTVVGLNWAMNLCPMDEPLQSVVQPFAVFPSTMNSLTLSP